MVQTLADVGEVYLGTVLKSTNLRGAAVADFSG